VRQYWHKRVSSHKRDSYAGVRLAKFPEDLRVYEHLIWASKPNVVIEIGTLCGGAPCGSGIGCDPSPVTPRSGSRW
jgi:cephalosporin hydroxylase